MKATEGDCPSGPVVKSPPANAEDMALIPGLGRPHMPWGNETQVPQPRQRQVYAPHMHTHTHADLGETAVILLLGTIRWKGLQIICF